MSGDCRIGARSGVEWSDVYDDRSAWDGTHPAAAEFTRWIQDYLIKPHPDLGREGPVCPFVRQAEFRRTVWAGLASGGDELTETAMLDAVDDALQLYLRLRLERGPEARLLSVVTLFPDLTRYDTVDAVHQSRKTTVVREGLMLGQFYPGCQVPGLWSADFRPLHAPVPMLVIRKMMNTDFPFLVGQTDWLHAYFTQFAPGLPSRLRWSIAERMRAEGPAAEEITELRAHSPGEHAR